MKGPQGPFFLPDAPVGAQLIDPSKKIGGPRAADDSMFDPVKIKRGS